MKHIDAFNAGGAGDVPGLIREIEGWVDAFAGAMRELDEQEVTGADDTGLVVATVSGSGRLLHVAIGPKAMRDLDHVAIGQAVQQAIGAARVAMAEGLTQMVDTLATGRPRPDPGHDPLAPYFDAILREK
ncbi:YbaB/EbfC family nucleoid-associated protein [Nonomuraea sp. NPDC005983]|uniref:YbaB/EbfC family nucleoid-associated protein n=1 Tax=Nonomuraea sp. NPDC005983 TaxID=3155595 RepID=UPI0033B2617E